MMNINGYNRELVFGQLFEMAKLNKGLSDNITHDWISANGKWDFSNSEASFDTFNKELRVESSEWDKSFRKIVSDEFHRLIEDDSTG